MAQKEVDLQQVEQLRDEVRQLRMENERLRRENAWLRQGRATRQERDDGDSSLRERLRRAEAMADTLGQSLREMMSAHRDLAASHRRWTDATRQGESAAGGQATRQLATQSTAVRRPPASSGSGDLAGPSHSINPRRRHRVESDEASPRKRKRDQSNSSRSKKGGPKKTPSKRTPQQCVACGFFDPHRNIRRHFQTMHSATFSGRRWVLTSEPYQHLPRDRRPSSRQLAKWRGVDRDWVGPDDSDSEHTLDGSDSDGSDDPDDGGDETILAPPNHGDNTPPEEQQERVEPVDIIPPQEVEVGAGDGAQVAEIPESRQQESEVQIVEAAGSASGPAHADIEIIDLVDDEEPEIVAAEEGQEEPQPMILGCGGCGGSSFGPAQAG